MSSNNSNSDDNNDNNSNSGDDSDAGSTNDSPVTTTVKSNFFNKINLTSSEQDEVVKEWNFKWRSRQRMAWTALITMIIITVIMMFGVSAEKIDKLSSIISWFYGATATITITYMGTAAASNIFQMKFKNGK